MKKEIYLTILFDYYGELFNDKQKDYFTNYYFSNLSLGEIAENLEVSRNAVHKQLKQIEERLVNYENKLHLYEKDEELKKVLLLMPDSKEKEEIKNIYGIK